MVDRLFKRRERESTVLYSVQLLWFATFLHVFFHDLTHSQTHIDLSGRGGAGRAINSCLCGGSRRPELPVQKKGHKFLKHHETATQQKV